MVLDLVVRPTVHAIQVPGAGGEENDAETICTEIMLGKFPKLVKKKKKKSTHKFKVSKSQALTSTKKIMWNHITS